MSAAVALSGVRTTGAADTLTILDDETAVLPSRQPLLGASDVRRIHVNEG